MDFKADHKTIKLQIGDSEYDITLYLSAGDVLYIIDYTNAKKKKYNIVVASIIEKHIIPKTPENLLIPKIIEDEVVLHTYIDAIVNEADDLKVFFDRLNNDKNICHRFLCAVYDKWKEKAGKSAIAMANAIEGPLSVINKQSATMLGNLANTATIIKNAIKPYSIISDKITKIISAYNQQISSILSGINIPRITEKRKQELRESYEIWGKWGWSIIPWAEINLYNEPPNTQEEANKAAMVYCKSDDMKYLFEEIRAVKGNKIKDFEEAVFNYENKKYKSCAMILFSLLDAKLIRMQKRSTAKRRATGMTAAINIKKHIESEFDINKKLFLSLSHNNLFACLSAFFDNANDFKVQPELANRNFVDHGMYRKNIRKRDCVQLFLLYYNFLSFFEIINNKQSSNV